MSRHTETGRAALIALSLCGAVLCSMSARAAEPVFRLELNKLEANADACRVYFVIRNGGDQAVPSFKPDLVFFDRKGVIASRLVVEGGPLPPAKTRVKLFDVKDLTCADVGSVLLNDLGGCALPSGGTCLAATETASRAGVDFTK